MINSIWEDLQREFRMGNMITRLILVNVVVYVFINLVWMIAGVASGGANYDIYDTVSQWLSLSGSGYFNLTHPWVVLTNMFLHHKLMHILFNMLFLYWFGRIVGDLIGDHRILPMYLLGGLAAGLTFFLTWKFLPYGNGTAIAYGASGSVMCIVVAAGILAPDYIMRLILIGDVKLKYIVAFLVLVDVILIGGVNNTGGHWAHLGGAAFGWLFVSQLRNGNDLAAPVNRLFANINGIFSGNKSQRAEPRRKAKAAAPRKNKFKIIRGEGASDSNEPTIDEQARLDEILVKIKKNGYDNLSTEEKEFLFKASNK